MKYKPGDKFIIEIGDPGGEIFGVSACSIVKMRTACGARGIRGQHKRPDMTAWNAFCCGDTGVEPQPETTPETITEAAQEAPEPIKSGADLANIAVLLKSLAGTGAKITIELTL